MIKCNKNPNYEIEPRFAQTHYLLKIAKKGQFDNVTGKRKTPERIQYVNIAQFEQNESFKVWNLFDVEVLHNPTIAPVKKRKTLSE